MAERYPNLLSPLTVRGFTFANRIVSAPYGGIHPVNGHIPAGTAEQIDDLCRDGLAQFTVGETDVDAKNARSGAACENHDMGDPEVFVPLSEYARQIKRHKGPLAVIELSAVGAIRRYSESRYPVLGPMSYHREDGEQVHAMTEADIEELCESFAHSSLVCKQAGYDGVILHMAHGWLFTQFLDPATNQRVDRFGGSLENRSRISEMVVQRIRRSCGEDFLIECRVSGQLNTKNGYSVEDICGYCRILSRYADIINVSGGFYYDDLSMMVSTMFDPHGCNVEVAAAIKKAVDIPVMVVGGINDPAQAERILAEGKADLIMLGRQYKSDSGFLRKLRSGREDEIRRCIRCTRCFPGPYETALAELGESFMQDIEVCAINPYYPLSDLSGEIKASVRKTVLVVGGGVAGLQAAVTAADRGHRVTLVEKEPRTGGLLNFAEHDEDKGDLKLLADSLLAQAKYRGVELRCGAPATAELVAQLHPDVIIAALGSTPATPPIPGIHGKNVVRGVDAYAPGAVPGSRVVVLGGGLVGCETAIHLARSGKQVSLVEMLPRLAGDSYRVHRLKVLDELDKRVRVYLNTRCLEICDGYVRVQTQGGKEEQLDADTVVYGLGMRSNPLDGILAMAGGIPVLPVGDCVRPDKILEALQSARRTAQSI